jgi:N-acetylglucosaminyldiphosphoundecaprenol N-acetyl-beta-D-mannosaminyltransferase
MEPTTKTANKIKRVYFLKVPVDLVDEEAFSKHVKELLAGNTHHQLTFLTQQGLFKARRRWDYYKCMAESSLILPVSKGIVRGGRLLRLGNFTRYNPFDTIINLLHIAEENSFSVYLLGAQKQDLELAERNLRTSFPNLKIIGRFSGYFNHHTEEDVILAIKKSHPAIILVGRGIKDKEMWILRNKKRLNPGISIWIDNVFEIFSGREKYISEGMFKAGLEGVAGISRKPWKFFRIFPYLYFNILLFAYKLFKLG